LMFSGNIGPKHVPAKGRKGFFEMGIKDNMEKTTLLQTVVCLQLKCCTWLRH